MAHGHPDFQSISTPTLPDFGEGQETWFQSETVEVAANSYEDLINYVVPDDMELRVCSGIVSCEAPRTQKFKFITTPAATWIFPYGFIDVDSVWYSEPKVYDGIIHDGAMCKIGASSWGGYLILLVNQVTIDKVRFYAQYGALQINQVDIAVYYGGAWHDVYEGTYANLEWVEKDINAEAQLISKARIRFYNAGVAGVFGILYGFQFDTAEATEQETIYFDTYAIIPYLPEAPYSVPAGATFVVRVYNDDDAAQYMSVNLAGFLQAKV